MLRLRRPSATGQQHVPVAAAGPRRGGQRAVAAAAPLAAPAAPAAPGAAAGVRRRAAVQRASGGPGARPRAGGGRVARRMSATDVFPDRLTAAKQAAIDALQGPPLGRQRQRHRGRPRRPAWWPTRRPTGAARPGNRVDQAVDVRRRTSADALKLAGELAARAGTRRRDRCVVTDDALHPQRRPRTSHRRGARRSGSMRRCGPRERRQPGDRRAGRPRRSQRPEAHALRERRQLQRRRSCRAASRSSPTARRSPRATSSSIRSAAPTW